MTFMTIYTMYCKFQYDMPAIFQRFTTNLTDSEWDDSNAFRAAAETLMFCALQDDFYALLRQFQKSSKMPENSCCDLKTERLRWLPTG